MFSKYEVYTTMQSVYCYSGTNILRNKLNIHDSKKLKEAEEEITVVKQLLLLKEPLKGRFTKNHLLRIHKYIFEDIYPFAGHLRRETISKGSTMFYPPNLIEKELDKVFAKIKKEKMLEEVSREKQINNMSYLMSELNIIHPFREGNGRTIREFIRCMALEYGMVINWGNTDKDTILEAAICSVDNSQAFERIIVSCIEK